MFKRIIGGAAALTCALGVTFVATSAEAYPSCVTSRHDEFVPYPGHTHYGYVTWDYHRLTVRNTDPYTKSFYPQRVYFQLYPSQSVICDGVSGTPNKPVPVEDVK